MYANVLSFVATETYIYNCPSTGYYDVFFTILPSSSINENDCSCSTVPQQISAQLEKKGDNNLPSNWIDFNPSSQGSIH